MGIDDPETVEEEVTPTEIAVACRGTVNEIGCEAIAEEEDSESALALAFSLLLEVVDDPEDFLRGKGILE